MTLLRRAPREIYRVYSEEEYLGGAGSELAGDIGEWLVDESPMLPEAAGRDGAPRRLHRVAGIALLAGAVGAVSCVVSLNVTRTHRDGGARRSLVAATHKAPLARAAALTDARPEVTSSQPMPARAVGISRRPHILPIGRGPAGPASHHRPTHPPIHPPVRRRVDVAVVADYVSRPSSEDEASEAPVSTPASTAPATASSSTASVNPPAEKRPEFGFER